MNGISSSSNTFGLPSNRYGMVDRTDQAIGLSEYSVEDSTPSMTQRDNLLMFDTRDCVGELSLRESQLAYAYETATQGKISPERFKRSLDSNGLVVPKKLIEVVKQMQTDGLISGFPQINDLTPYIRGNQIFFRLQNVLKLIKSLEIINAIIPRDLIPMYVYFPGFINNCLPFVLTNTGLTYINPTSDSPSSTWQTPIPETANDFYDSDIEGISSNKLGGVYYTPLRYWRCYTGPNCMPNPHTPPPYQLWNPPQDNLSDNPWPFQPQPVRGQRIPTYVAKNGVVFSGYGLYDLEDFPAAQELQLADGTTIQIPMRKLLLKLIVPDGQYINGVSAEQLIDISTIDDFNDSGIVDNPLTQTGYGDYQRFIPGPGIAMNYQPNQWRLYKSAPIDLSCSTYDSDTGYLGPMPVPFPNFRGNVWGPYSRPGDRFQNKGLQQTVDELYLNGDLSNLEGNSILYPNWNPVDEPYKFEYYTVTLKRSNNIVRFQSVESSTNPNIKNSMRVDIDGGFGAVYAYVGKNTLVRGSPGPIITGGLPNTQYDGSFHRINPQVWITPRTDVPNNWIESLPGPQKPTIVSSDTFPGWMYIWRDIFPWTGSIYVPTTAGGVGPMEYYDCDNTSPEWKKSVSVYNQMNLTSGSEQWVNSPVIGQSNFYCIPSGNPSIFEYVSNLTYGNVLSCSLTWSGSGYTDGGTYNVVKYDTITPSSETEFTLDVSSVNSINGITGFGYIYVGTVSTETVMLVSTPTTAGLSSGNNCTLYTDGFGGLFSYTGGALYSVQNGVLTTTEYGLGTGLTINITSVDTDGKILTFDIDNAGFGYSTNDLVRIIQQGSNNNAFLQIDSATDKPEDLIPKNNLFHYMDPLASGPGISGNTASLVINYVDGVDVCDEQCAEEKDNCDAPLGEYEFRVGNVTSSFSGAEDNPTLNRADMLKCDFIAQEGPGQEWNGSNKNCRPLDNIRIKQTSNYISRRTSYSDYGSNNGILITQLVNYRLFFVTSTPDTDLVINIKQAERTVYTQSLNAQVDASNFYIPIRLNLGTTSGTLEYVEAVQGTLTSSGVYWIKNYYPPKAELAQMEMTLTTYDGTPIPIERCLGFIEQFSTQSSLFSASVLSSFVLSGNYSEYSPNLPPFTSTFSTTPSGVIISANNNSKSLTDPFDSKTSRYTQRNLGFMFKIVTYNAINPGINPIIKRMPESLQQTELFVDNNNNVHELIPLANNIDDYSF